MWYRYVSIKTYFYQCSVCRKLIVLNLYLGDSNVVWADDTFFVGWTSQKQHAHAMWIVFTSTVA